MLAYALQLAVLILIPLWIVVTLVRRRDDDRFRWGLRVLYGAAFLLYVFVAGRWDLGSVYLRYVIAVAFVAAALVSLRRAGARPLLAPGWRHEWPSYLGSLALAGIFAGFALGAVRGRLLTDEAVELAFPLRDGWYYVGQGGDSRLVNYHNVYPAQRFALDIVALDRRGARARGLYPADLGRYVIFDAEVRSPCDGQIIAAVDGREDLVPPTMDRANPAGNHVVIACGDALVLLAHLRRGSVAVQANAAVGAGDLLGNVGNSGNTSEPHLHIHAVRARGAAATALQGEGAPIVFDGRFLARNMTVRVGAQ
jgi:hypothetical protein